MWNQQIAKDNRVSEEEQQLAQELEDQQWAQRELVAENEHKEMEHKRPKMNDFDENMMVSDFITPPPSVGLCNLTHWIRIYKLMTGLQLAGAAPLDPASCLHNEGFHAFNCLFIYLLKNDTIKFQSINISRYMALPLTNTVAVIDCFLRVC